MSKKPKTPSAESAASPRGPVSSLNSYYLLGRSGLRVSPLCLGAMTFGTEWGFGSEEKTSEAIFRRYVDAGGNFIDTANAYTKGTSETMLGHFLTRSGLRDRLVIATKYTINMHPGDPNAGGNSRKNMMQSIDESLRRLRTDYIDLYWVHMDDGLTPLEEVMSGLDSLVRAGKVRYVGFSDFPAWKVARAQTLAQLRGWAPLCALQLEYSLIQREIERELVPCALELGMGIAPWSPLGGGLLSGKYSRPAGKKTAAAGRLNRDGAPPSVRLAKDRNWDIVEALVDVAKKVGRSPAQVALNWITRRPGVVSTIIGASRLEQLEDNLNAIEFVLPADLSARLDEVSKVELGFPHDFLAPGGFVDNMLKTGRRVEAKPDWFGKG